MANLRLERVPQLAMAHAVAEIDKAADHEPDSEPLPRRTRKSEHRVNAGGCPDQRHRPNERDAERPRSGWLEVPQHENTQADDRKCRQGTDIGEVVNLVFI